MGCSLMECVKTGKTSLIPTEGRKTLSFCNIYPGILMCCFEC